jgi:hypothetical protein
MNETPNLPTTSSFLQQDEIYFTAFEPKTRNRFICYINDKEKKLLIPTYLLKNITRPSCRREIGQDLKYTEKWIWNPIEIETYDPIVPSATQIFYSYMIEPRPFDLIIKILGPVGDIVEEWEINDAEFISIDFGDLDWSAIPKDGESQIDLTIKATIKYSFAKLLY